jgi:hypothetical protein
VLPEKVDDIEHFPAFVLRVIEPECPSSGFSGQRAE